MISRDEDLAFLATFEGPKTLGNPIHLPDEDVTRLIRLVSGLDAPFPKLPLAPNKMYDKQIVMVFVAFARAKVQSRLPWDGWPLGEPP